MEFTPPAYLPPPAPLVDAGGVRRFAGATYAITPGYRPRLLDVSVPPGGGRIPLVIWIHGGGWLDGDRRYPPPTLTPELLFGSVVQAGMAVASIDYRHSLEASFPAQLHDVKAAIRYLRRFAGDLGLDPGRFGLWGESAGGHLGALAALTGASDEGQEGVREGDSRVGAVVDWYGPADLAAALAEPPLPMPPGHPEPYAALLGGAPELAREASPVTHVTAAAPPFLLVHGTEDQIVSCKQSELLEARLREAGAEVRLTTIQGADHIFLGAPDIPAIVAESVAFLADHLRR